MLDEHDTATQPSFCCGVKGAVKRKPLSSCETSPPTPHLTPPPQAQGELDLRISGQTPYNVDNTTLT